jgi:K+-transporting ATPase KdpF subunit
VFGFASGFVNVVNFIDRRIGQDDGRGTMSLIYLVGGLVSIGLLIYLIFALLKPEWF